MSEETVALEAPPEDLLAHAAAVLLDNMPVADPESVSVFVAMNRVMREIGAIPKDETGPKTQGSYAFRGIDTFMNRLHPIMAKHGVFVLPQVLERSRYEFHDTQTSAGKPAIATHALLDIEFTFYGPQGDRVVAITKGENLDTGDKASNGAMSAALKYCLMQAFMIPTSDIVDGDRSDNTLERFEDARSETQIYWQSFGWPAESDEAARTLTDDANALAARIKAAGEQGAEIGQSVMAGAGRKWPPDPDQFRAIDKALAQLEAPFDAGPSGEDLAEKEAVAARAAAEVAASEKNDSSPSNEETKTEEQTAPPADTRREFSEEELSLAGAIVEGLKMGEVTKSLTVLGVTLPKNTTVGMARNMLLQAWQMRGLDLDGVEAHLQEVSK